MLSHIQGYSLTEHAQKRCQQRGIRENDLLAVFQYGRVTHTHGRLCYTMTDRAAAGTPLAKSIDRLRGMALIVDPQQKAVITVKHRFDVSERPGMLRRAQQCQEW